MLVPVGVGVLRGEHLGRPLPGQGAVLRPGRHREVDVPAGRIGVPAVDQPLDHAVDLGDVAGRPRLDRGRVATQGGVRRGEGPLVDRRQLPGRYAELLRLGDQLVLDVGDVADIDDAQPAVGQPPAQDVEVDRAADVADVRRALHGRATQVHGRNALDARTELANGPGCGVVQLQAHGRSLRAYDGHRFRPVVRRRRRRAKANYGGSAVSRPRCRRRGDSRARPARGPGRTGRPVPR